MERRDLMEEHLCGLDAVEMLLLCPTESPSVRNGGSCWLSPLSSGAQQAADHFSPKHTVCPWPCTSWVLSPLSQFPSL